MRQSRVFAFFFLLVGCQGKSIENAAVRPQDEVQGSSAQGWTIEETMKVRHIDNVRISTDRRRVLFVVRAAALSSDKGEYHTRIYTVDADGTNQRPLTPAEYSTTAAEWSPDGRWIAFLSNGLRKSEGNSIWLIPAEGGRPHQIDVGGTGVTNLKWAPSGGQIAFTMPAVQAAHPRAQQDPAAPQVMDAAVPSTQLWVVGVSSDGTALEPPRALTSVRLHVHTDTEFGNPFEWSPGGKAIVFAHNANNDWWSSWPSTGISIVDVASGHTRSLAGPAMAPSYSPDGRWVAYLGSAGRYAPHNLDVFVVSADGGEPRKLAETFDRHPTLIGWSADGARLYVQEARRSVARLSALPLTGERVVDLDPGDAVLGAVALDPSRTVVAFTRQTLERPVEAYLTPLDEFHAVRVSRVNAGLPAHAGGVISGIGWSNITDEFIGGATVAGSYSPPAIQFDLHPRLGGTPWHFNGTVDTLSRSIGGEFAFVVGTGFPLVLRAADTIPTGVYDLELDSGTRELLTGSAGFSYLFDTRRLAIVLQTQGAVAYHTSVMWNGPTLPMPGTYRTAPVGSGEPTVGLQRVRGTGIEAIYEVGPGTITIDVSDRYVLAGRYTIAATDPDTRARLTLRGTFSAGCFGGNRC